MSHVLVVGSGLAGGIAALKAAEQGAEVTVLHMDDSASRWAQGGIVYPGDSDLKQDILNAGCGRNYQAAVNFLVNNGRRAVDQWLVQILGVPFDREANGEYSVVREAAHSQKRIFHVKDKTGAAISDALHAALSSHPRIRLRQGHLIDLLLSNKHGEDSQARYGDAIVTGAYAFFDGKVEAIQASAVVLASGGFSQLFQHATGPDGSLGEGIAAAHRVGARTLDLEYVQFHPTALFVPGEPRRLLTEALRGAGAKLLDRNERPFVDELQPRDVVSRAIHQVMLSSGTPHVWIDLRSIDQFDSRFPQVFETLRHYGFQPDRELIPVVPAAHYTIGGVWTDLSGATNVPGLYAAGEVACSGVHGANRLASTSLLEAAVFGEVAGQSAASFENLALSSFRPRSWAYADAPVDPSLLHQDWQLLKQTMWNYVGLQRSQKRLRRAEHILTDLRNEMEKFYAESALSHSLISLRHSVLLATLVLYAALKNRHSVGTHFLEDRENF